MELSTVTLHTILPQTQIRQNSSSLTSAKSTTATNERNERQMKSLEGANAFLKQVPDKKTLDRKDKVEKITMLKERLKILKKIIPFMNPSAVKSLKSELRQIASQLSALSNDGIGGYGIDAVIPADANQEDANKPKGSAKADESDEASNVKVEAVGVFKTEEQISTKNRSDSNELHHQEAFENLQIQGDLDELKRLYRKVRDMAQRKLQQANDKGEPLPNGSPALKAYLIIPEIENNLETKA